jgi:hypothetical protein
MKCTFRLCEIIKIKAFFKNKFHKKEKSIFQKWNDAFLLLTNQNIIITY